MDKKKISAYSSSITSRINDIVKLNELGVEGYSNTQAEKQITELLALQKQIKAITAAPKKPKKISVKAIKFKIPKAKKIKVKSIKSKKVKVYKLPKIKKMSTRVRKLT